MDIATTSTHTVQHQNQPPPQHDRLITTRMPDPKFLRVNDAVAGLVPMNDFATDERIAATQLRQLVLKMQQ